MAWTLSQIIFRRSTRPSLGRDLIRQADATRDSGNPGSAALLYRQAIELGVNEVGVRKQLANMLKDSGQYEDALYQYSRCLEAEPADGDTLLQLGHLFKLQGDLERAATFYTRAASSPTTEVDATGELEHLAQARSTQHDAHAPEPNFLTSAQDGPVSALTRFVQELGARVDGLASGLASNGSVMSREDQASMQEMRNNWQALMPMFLNTASTIATMGRDIDTLNARVQRLEGLNRADEAHLDAQPSPASTAGDTSQSDATENDANENDASQNDNSPIV